MTAMLALRGLSHNFGATRALKSVDLEIRRGEVHAILGENGAGKSTLMQCCAGVLRADHGEMWLDGRHFSPVSPAMARRVGVEMVFQELSSVADLTIAENLFLGREVQRLGVVQSQQMLRRTKQMLTRVGLEKLDPQTQLQYLSVAQRQLVELARCYLFESKVVILDEPTSSLGQREVAQVLDIVAEMKNAGISVIFVSHALEQVEQVADRWTVLRNGEVVGTGERQVGVQKIWLEMMSGELPAADGHPRREPVPARASRPEIVLRASKLASRMRAGIFVDLELARGQVLGIAGLVGCGRTSLLRQLAGLDAIESGTLEIFGRQVASRNGYTCWPRGVGFVSEDRREEGMALQDSLTSNLFLPSLSSQVRRGWLSWKKLERDAQHLLAANGVAFSNVRQASCELSGGNQQKIALARLFAANCEIFLLDEPTRGIDHRARLEVLAAIRERTRPTASRGAAAVLMVSSYLPELFETCDSIAVMRDGQLSAPRSVDQWTPHEILALAHHG